MVREALGQKTGVSTPDRPAVNPLPKTKEKKPLGKGAKIALATALVLTGVEGTGTAIQENINHEPVSGHTLVQDVMWPATLIGSFLKEDVPSIFDNKKGSGVAGDNNIHLITLDQEGQFNIEPVSTPDALIFPFPFKPPKGTVIKYDRRLSEILPFGIDKSGAESKGIKDNIEVTLPKGTIIYAPMNAHIFVFQGFNQNDPNLTRSINLVYYDFNADIVYDLWFAFDKPVQTSLKISKDYVTFSDREWEGLPNTHGGDQIANISEDNTVFTLRLFAFKGKNLAGASFVENSILKTPEFTTDNNSKLLVLQK